MSDEGQPTSRRIPAYKPALPRKLRMIIVAGPDKGRALDLESKVYVVGKDPSCDVALSDPHVSRRHLEFDVLPDGVEFRDLGSTNGSFYGGVRFEVIRGGAGTSVSIGDTEIRVMEAESEETQPNAGLDRLGSLVAQSHVMREVFAMARQVATSELTVLVEGETGTGKELLAEAIHLASPHRKGPFVICDLAAVTRTLIESELFGHVRGAFTGADRDRPGAFAQADGGTLFLDEVGELDPEIQPRLLRALETGQIKPVGKSAYEHVDVRVIAATNRDLSEEVRAGRFRRDLYHRLAVVRLALPPLRERPEDIEILAAHFMEQVAAASGRTPPAVSPTTSAALCAYEWPGNVRELKNVIERALSISPNAPVLDSFVLGLEERSVAAVPGREPGPDEALSFKEVKDRLVEAWEREYVSMLLGKSGGNVSLAARRAGMARVSLHRLLKKHGLGGSGSD